MARVTVEDCMEVIENRFALSVVAMKRAKQIVMKKVEHRENEKKLAGEDTELSEQDIPSPEVVERNLDKSSRVQDEHKPVITALKEIADKQIEFSRPDGGKSKTQE